MNTKVNLELWEKTLTTLKSITSCKEKIVEVEKIINQLTTEIAESSRRSMLNNPGDIYEQLHALARLSAIIENLNREMEELEMLEKKLHAVQKRIEMDFTIMEQIREQLQKKLKIIAKESSETKQS
ncbi:MAG: hypothetical protein ACUVQM_00165 [Candidatus Hadarchaeaceae archaeon]